MLTDNVAQPSGIVVDPSGKSLVPTGEKPDTISAYSIDRANGALRLLCKSPTGKGTVEIVGSG